MSSFVFAVPENLAAASASLTGLGSSIQQAHAAAAGSTTQIAAAAQDEVSAAISAVFGGVEHTHGLSSSLLSTVAVT